MTDALQPKLKPPEPTAQQRGLSAGDYALIVAVAVVVAVIGLALVKNNGQPLSGRAPDFAFTTFDGQEMSLHDLRGDVVVLNFWASWCGPCEQEAPALRAAWERYKGRDVQFLGIAYADNDLNSLAFVDEHGLNYLNAPDRGTHITELYSIQGVPETYIIDQNGEVAEFIYAGVSFEQLTEAIDRLLEE